MIGGGGELVHEPIAVGVALGLVVGKPLGVLGGSYLVTRFTHAELNDDLTWRDLAGVAVLAGIGFTVSLLVSDLTFDGDRRSPPRRRYSLHRWSPRSSVGCCSTIAAGPGSPT